MPTSHLGYRPFYVGDRRPADANAACTHAGRGALLLRSQHQWLMQPKESNMPRGDKSAYSDKQKRKAEHIEEGYEDRGVGKKEAESRAWATVNKESGGGEKSGSGRGKPENHASSRKGGRLGGAAAVVAYRSGALGLGQKGRSYPQAQRGEIRTGGEGGVSGPPPARPFSFTTCSPSSLANAPRCGSGRMSSTASDGRQRRVPRGRHHDGPVDQDGVGQHGIDQGFIPSAGSSRPSSLYAASFAGSPHAPAPPSARSAPAASLAWAAFSGIR
jgi:plasmid stabilization system protein ParE